MDFEFHPIAFAIVYGGWIFSLCLHEFAHALVAWHGGDKSVREKGYLSFNPFAYAHPFASFGLPILFLFLGGFGLPGGAVYIDRGRLWSRHWECAVSLAGPLANAVLLLALAAPFWLGLVPRGDEPAAAAYAFLCRLQVMAILFNLLPVPPLDGYQAIAAYLRMSRREWIDRNGHIFLLALIVLLWRVPAANAAFWGTVDAVSSAVGVPSDLADRGLTLILLPVIHLRAQLGF